MVTDGVLATIQFTQLFTIFGGDFETAIQGKFEQHEILESNLPIKANMFNIQIEDLIFIKELSPSQYKEHYLVKHKDQNNYFVLKCISKAQIVQEEYLKTFILQEKKVVISLLFSDLLKHQKIKLQSTFFSKLYRNQSR
ncbi:unnamed protein product [Paramecium octaurelia]|uniref:Uncharacterized protein n=1 Tax=Paramecium octaurelia TaxID=43137 RepID=A0A8S1SFL1_PAROT|nr:unnamed protein product [Paramecium octaurelia]